MTATAEATVEKLTDDAIKKRIALIDRLATTRQQHIDELQAELTDLRSERYELVTAQIARLRAQLPAAEVDQ